jgi:hypothetical protein
LLIRYTYRNISKNTTNNTIIFLVKGWQHRCQGHSPAYQC